MEKPEIHCEVPCGGRKRELSEADIVEDSDDSEESDYSTDWDSDDPYYEILEGKADRKIWKQYHKEWDESEGFDISVHPGTSFSAGICPYSHYLTIPSIKEECTELCKLAIHDFNAKNDKMYAFKDIVNVNTSSAAGTWYYFTFTAHDTTVDVADAEALETFQALVWDGIDGTRDVSFCRVKEFLSTEDKKKKRKEKKKKSQQDVKAEVEQDKPFLVESLPGLVIEELSKGEPRGKKARAGFKVGIRYTAKLKENDKVFDSNIEKGDPLEFRIASGQLIKGWEIGVVGMRVGDKRRITIPPALWYGAYGAKGHLVVVPLDSWLVIEVELIYIRSGFVES